MTEGFTEFTLPVSIITFTDSHSAVYIGVFRKPHSRHYKPSLSVLQDCILGYASICIITCICLLGDCLFACQDALVKEFERKPSVIRDLFGEPHTLVTTVVVTLAAGIFGSLVIHNMLGPAHTCSTGGVKST